MQTTSSIRTLITWNHDELEMENEEILKQDLRGSGRRGLRSGGESDWDEMAEEWMDKMTKTIRSKHKPIRLFWL